MPILILIFHIVPFFAFVHTRARARARERARAFRANKKKEQRIQKIK